MDNHNPFSLQGKTILVTGASSGIGKATAIECSKLGATLVITGRNGDRLASTYSSLDKGKENLMFCYDLTDEGGIGDLISKLPKLDGIVQCAGRGFTSSFKFARREKIDEVFNINFYAQIELLRQIYKKKILTNGASVVLIASISGVTTFTPLNIIYEASKAALHSTMKSCAKEFAPRIRINCICPGMVDTPLIHSCNITEEQLNVDMKQYPMKRYGRPEEIAWCAAYLLSDAAAWITGQDIVIDGGVTV